MSAPVETQECRECHREFPLIVKYWSQTNTGVCRNCEDSARRLSREDARLWRDFVLTRADGRCEACGFFCPPILRVHHINPVKKLGHGGPGNLIALCPNCHAVVHAVSGGSKNDEQRAYGLSIWMEQAYSERACKMLSELVFGRLEYVDGRWHIPGWGDV